MNKIILLSVGAIVAIHASPSSWAFDALKRMEVHASAIYNKPSNNGLLTGADQLIRTGTFFGASHNNYIEPDFAWNYALGFSYNYPCSHTRFFADYERFNDNKNQALSGVAEVGVYNGLSSERVEMKQYEVRAGLQHFLRFGPQFYLDLSAYLEYDRLSQVLYQSNFNGIQLTNSTLTDSSLESKNTMHGFGPGIGLKLLGVPVASSPHLKLFAGLMTTLLYADQSGSFGLFGSGFNGVNEFTNFLIVSSEPAKAILSKFNVDFGIDYSRKMWVEGSPLLVGLTIGVEYINIVNGLKYNNFVLPSLNTVPPFSQQSSQDWGHAGPYIQFKVGGPKS